MKYEPYYGTGPLSSSLRLFQLYEFPKLGHCQQSPTSLSPMPTSVDKSNKFFFWVKQKCSKIKLGEGGLLERTFPPTFQQVPKKMMSGEADCAVLQHLISKFPSEN